MQAFLAVEIENRTYNHMADLGLDLTRVYEDWQFKTERKMEKINNLMPKLSCVEIAHFIQKRETILEDIDHVNTLLKHCQTAIYEFGYGMGEILLFRNQPMERLFVLQRSVLWLIQQADHITMKIAEVNLKLSELSIIDEIIN